MSKQRRPASLLEIGGVEVSVYTFKDEEYVPVRAFCKLTGRRNLPNKDLIIEVTQLDPEAGQWFHNVSKVMKVDVFLDQLERHKFDKLDEAREKLTKRQEHDRRLEFWPKVVSLTKAIHDLSEAQLDYTKRRKERIAVEKALYEQARALSLQMAEFQEIFLTDVGANVYNESDEPDELDEPDDADEAEQPKVSKKRSRK